MNTIDIIIPTYKPGKKLNMILGQLARQTRKVNKIILINTDKVFFDAFVYNYPEYNKGVNVDLHHITKEEFDHGATRHMGISMSNADIVVCMTDDAIPRDEFLIEKLVAPLEKGEAVSAYARQLPGKSADITEKYTRKFNYPEKSSIKSKADLEKLGIKTYFCSDVCAAYVRNVYNELGGFVRKTIFNEDMIYASKVINAGYSIAYVAEAKVVHHHKYTCVDQLRRNFDLGVSHKEYAEVFDSVPPAKEGAKLVSDTANFLLRKGMFYKIPGLIVVSGFKYIGYKLGKNYNMLPKKLVLKISMNSNYFHTKNIN